jgi:hypothetical protein
MPETYTDAIAKLKADHDKTEALFAKAEEANPAETRRIGIQVCNLVKIHMTLEEEFLYPALRGKDAADEDKLTEGLVEHDSGKVLINDLLSGENGDETFGPKLQVLGEQMEHHHKEEEEPAKGVFWQAREAKLDLVAMLEAMLAREAELKAQLKDGDLPEAETLFVDAGRTS